MERYTYKKDHYGCEDILSKCIYPRYEDGNDKPVAYYGQAIDKLAEYEDTGLTPKQIKELFEIFPTNNNEIPRFPCKIGDTVYVIAECEYINKIIDQDTGHVECPFESDCEFKERDNGNKGIFETVVESIFNSGNGWYYTFKDLCIEAHLSDFGRIAFTTRTEAEATIVLEEMEMNRLTIQYDEYFVPKELCTIDRLGGADDCMSCEEYCQANGNNCDDCGIQKCFEKLAAYENTGLTPEQIKELQGKQYGSQYQKHTKE